MSRFYTEQVYKYRVMRQLNDAERNPNGEWSLVFSSMDFGCAKEELMDCMDTWAKCGDAFKLVTASVGVETIERLAY